MFLTTIAFAFLILSNGCFKVQVLGQTSTCPPGFVRNPRTQVCYYISDQKASFETADRYCEKMVSSLASLHDINEVSFLQRALKDLEAKRVQCKGPGNCINFWVGIDYTNPKPNDTTPWQWSPEVGNLATYWAPYLSGNTRQCAAIRFTYIRQYWFGTFSKEKHCDLPLRYICKKYVTCPAGYDLIPAANNCYKVFEEKISWLNAFLRCFNDPQRARLAYFTRKSQVEAVNVYLEGREIEFRKQFSGEIPSHGYYWIGAKRLVAVFRVCDGPFSWQITNLLTAELNFDQTSKGLNSTIWTDRIKSCLPNREYALYIAASKNYTWGDELCDYQMMPLCQLYPQLN